MPLQWLRNTHGFETGYDQRILKWCLPSGRAETDSIFPSTMTMVLIILPTMSAGFDWRRIVKNGQDVM